MNLESGAGGGSKYCHRGNAGGFALKVRSVKFPNWEKGGIAMHYANGREANNGDKIVFMGYGGPTVGILYDAVAGNDYCNGKIAVTKPNDPCPNLKECLHLDDVLALLPAQEGALAQSHPDIFKRIALVPDSSKGL